MIKFGILLVVFLVFFKIKCEKKLGVCPHIKKLTKEVKKEFLKGIDRKKFKYHTWRHTFQYLLPNAIKIGEKSGLSEEEMLLLKTSAMFYYRLVNYFFQFFSGYNDKDCEYEKFHTKSTEKARDGCKKWSYTEKQIDEIEKIILLAKENNPGDNIVAQALCDALLSYFGMDNNNFFDHIDKMIQEIREIKGEKDSLRKSRFQKKTMEFMKTHVYSTDGANEIFFENKMKNIITLQTIATLFPDSDGWENTI